MSLCIPADGILRTHVSWEDLQKELCFVFGNDAILGEDKEITDIGAGNGFMSKIGLLKPAWKTQNPLRPKEIVVKICSFISLSESPQPVVEDQNQIEMFKQMIQSIEHKIKKIHNSEVSVYEFLRRTAVKGLVRPKVYYSQRFDEGANALKGFLIMEYIPDAKPVNIFNTLTPEEVHQPLRCIAALEAATTALNEKERKLLSFNPFTEIFGDVINDNAISVTMSMLKKSVPELIEKVDKLEVISKDLDFEKYNAIAEDLGMKRVICHGDLWSNNLLWRKEDGFNRLAAIVDFQTAHLGCPAYDLCRLFNATLSGADRRANWKPLLEAFYGYLQEEHEKLGVTELPYTKEQLIESYERFLPMGAFLVIPMIGPLFQMFGNSDNLEESAKMREIVLEKTECLIDDLLEQYEKNKQLETAN